MVIFPFLLLAHSVFSAINPSLKKPSASLGSLYSPEQVHLSLGFQDSSMIVTWASQIPSYGAVVEYTPVSSPDQPVSSFAYSAPGTWVTFPNLSNPRILQRHLHSCNATMTGLILGQWYKYRVGSEIYGWSEIFPFEAKKDFTVNPLARLLVYGDFGIGEQIDATMSRLLQETFTYKYEAVIHNGDMAYDVNSYQGTYGDRFFNTIYYEDMQIISFS